MQKQRMLKFLLIFFFFFVDQSMMTEWAALISVTIKVVGHPGDACTMSIDHEGVPQEVSALVPQAGLWMKLEI